MPEKVIVRIAQGSVRGQKVKTQTGTPYYSFHGIPYAKPPVGPLRFKPPEPAEPWEGIRDALKEAAVAPQTGLFTNNEFAGEEDCLFINVFTPTLPTNSTDNLKPVMAYIHGGGFYLGSGNSEMHGPGRMMNTGEFVLVTMNYRLGALGFLSTGDSVVPGNNGLKDQVLSLKWVQENIAQFGGDPRNVTIGGVSAGGASVHLQVVSPMSKGLFHRAIAQSGVATCPWSGGDPEIARCKAFRLGEALGCKTSKSEELVEFLRKVPAIKLVEIDNMLKEEEKHPLPIFFLPVVEKGNRKDAFLPDRPIDIIKEGKFNKVPLIIGVASREGLIIVEDFLKNSSWYNSLSDDFAPALTVNLKMKKGTQEVKELSNKIKEFYFDNKPVSMETVSHLVDFYGDIFFNIWAYRSAKEQSARSSSPVYLYQFSYCGSLGYPAPNADLSGAGHGADLGYLFETAFTKTHYKDPEDEDMKMSSKLMKMWINFAKTGNPTPQVDPLLGVTWNTVTKNGSNYLNIDKEFSMQTHFMKDNMHFWDSNSTPVD